MALRRLRPLEQPVRPAVRRVRRMTTLTLRYHPWYVDRPDVVTVTVLDVAAGGDLHVVDVAGVENGGRPWDLLAYEIDHDLVTVDDGPHGHCDTCGYPCDEQGCMRDRRHRAAISSDESILVPVAAARGAEVYVAVTIADGVVRDLEVLNEQPRWEPLPGQSFHVANVNGGDSIPVTPERRRQPGPAEEQLPHLLVTLPETYGSDDGYHLHHVVASITSILRRWDADTYPGVVLHQARSAGEALDLPVYRRWADGTLSIETGTPLP